MTNGSTDGPEAVLPGPKKGRAVNEELRGVAVAAVLREGVSATAAARRLGLGKATVCRWVRQFREHGHVRPARQGGSASRIEPERERILRILAARPELSIPGLRDALAAEGVAFHATTVRGFLKRHGLERENRRARQGGRGVRRPARQAPPRARSPHPG